MRKIVPFLFLVLTVVPVASGQRVNVLEPSGKWVTDNGDFLSIGQERILEQMLSGYADSTSTQIVIVTLKDLQGASASDYAVALGRKWKIGQEGKNNGIVILLTRAERDVYISTGYGMEGAITDALSGKIIRSLMIPRFRKGQFFEGLRDGVSAVIMAASGEFAAEDLPADRESGGRIPLSLIIMIGFIVYSIFASRGKHGGRGRGHRRNGSLLPIILWSALGAGGRGGFGGGGFGGGGFGGGGFGGGGGSFGGGGAGGSW